MMLQGKKAYRIKKEKQKGLHISIEFNNIGQINSMYIYDLKSVRDCLEITDALRRLGSSGTVHYNQKFQSNAFPEDVKMALIDKWKAKEMLPEVYLQLEDYAKEKAVTNGTELTKMLMNNYPFMKVEIAEETCTIKNLYKEGPAYSCKWNDSISLQEAMIEITRGFQITNNIELENIKDMGSFKEYMNEALKNTERRSLNVREESKALDSFKKTQEKEMPQKTHKKRELER